MRPRSWSTRGAPLSPMHDRGQSWHEPAASADRSEGAAVGAKRTFPSCAWSSTSDMKQLGVSSIYVISRLCRCRSFSKSRDRRKTRLPFTANSFMKE
jgi:hypothetical protein